MILRAAKALLVCALAFWYLLVVFNNLTDYDSNYQFVRHVLSMDSTFPGNHGLWRALRAPLAHTVFYDAIIAWEILTLALLAWGGVRMLRAVPATNEAFRHSKNIAVAGMTLSLLMWLVAFLGVGEEWFLMWQSHTWNGTEAAFRMFVIIGIVLLFITRPEREQDF